MALIIFGIPVISNFTLSDMSLDNAGYFIFSFLVVFGFSRIYFFSLDRGWVGAPNLLYAPFPWELNTVLRVSKAYSK